MNAYPTGASAYDLLDMAGNVWEWTDSWYQAYPGSTHKDEYYGEKYRVLRGGSWVDIRSIARCAFRYDLVPVSRYNFIGLRVVSPSS